MPTRGGMSGRNSQGRRINVARHAVALYRASLEGATGLQRTLLEHRIADASVIQTNSVGMKFVYIEPGTFIMGSPAGEPGADGETPHNVTITRPFLIATTTVTQAQWKAVMGNNPSHVQGDELPVGSVTWNDALTFCKKLGEKEGRHYRLPTEAEWEYTCRAGTQLVYGASKISTRLDGIRTTAAVTPTPLRRRGRTHGGFTTWWETCGNGAYDWSGSYGGDATDPKGNDNGSDRVVRGGYFGTAPDHSRAGFRHWAPPGWHGDDTGFRVCVDF